MSVEYALYTIDWPIFNSELSESDDEYEYVTSLAPNEAAESLLIATDLVINTIDELLKPAEIKVKPEGFFKKLLSKPKNIPEVPAVDCLSEIEKINEVFSKLFWGWRDEEHRLNELNCESEMVEVAMQPSTVKVYSERLFEINVTWIEKKWSKTHFPNPRFNSFSEFERYCEDWATIFKECAAESNGLIIYAFG